jgi:hypothetical protein
LRCIKFLRIRVLLLLLLLGLLLCGGAAVEECSQLIPYWPTSLSSSTPVPPDNSPHVSTTDYLLQGHRELAAL